VDVFLVPVAVEYIKGLEKCINENELDGLIFVARDGYFFYNLYNKLSDRGFIKKMPTFYILSSRILSLRTGLENESDIDFVFKKYGLYENEQVRCSIFGEKLSDEMKKDNKSEQVLTQLHRNRNNYHRYLERCDIDFNKNYLLCELDGQGTAQHFLENFFENNLQGFYYLSIINDNPYELKRNFVHSMSSQKNEYSPIERNAFFLECCFSSPEKSVCGINDDLSVEYKIEPRTDEDIQFMQDIQEELLNKSEKFMEITSDYGCTLSKELVEVIFNKFSIVEFKGQVKCINNMVLADELTGNARDVWE
jgi:hypothetical protein